MNNFHCPFLQFRAICTRQNLVSESRSKDDYIRGAKGRFAGRRGHGGGTAVDKSGKSGIMNKEYIPVGKSVGAKAKNYDIMDLKTGEHFQLVEGTYLQNVYVFAGKGSKTAFKKVEKYAKIYGGNPLDWQHVKGFGTIDYYGDERRAELHWVQCEGCGKHDFFVKEWLD